ncbi:MAG: carboxylating nicotinate-nucleotide diphosphorylase [Candidatus Cloacimonetes bacterium]|nr:carboxylating nicotinate-nucleotide diphosphorylase [Candidatus Cloacimonadota bacterium]
MKLNSIIEEAIFEDLGNGDITTECLDLGPEMSVAFFVAKEAGVIAGLDIAFKVFTYIDPEVKCVAYKKDGDQVEANTEIAKITGRSASLLKAERVALNFLQRMCGIATSTRKYSKKIENTKTKLLDTRKTTPLLRSLEKYAVRVGGGFNHRFGLYDMIMIKENHIRAAGSITEAVKRVKHNDTSHKIEVETTNLEEVDEAVKSGADRIMLDNMDIETMQSAVAKYTGQTEFEASGNVNLDNIEKIASTGVDFISVGAITHSYKSMDISLLFRK